MNRMKGWLDIRYGKQYENHWFILEGVHLKYFTSPPDTSVNILIEWYSLNIHFNGDVLVLFYIWYNREKERHRYSWEPLTWLMHESEGAERKRCILSSKMLTLHQSLNSQLPMYYNNNNQRFLYVTIGLSFSQFLLIFSFFHWLNRQIHHLYDIKNFFWDVNQNHNMILGFNILNIICMFRNKKRYV